MSEGKRRVTLIVEIDDTDLAQLNFNRYCDEVLQPKYLKFHGNTDHVKEDNHYKKLIKARKELSNEIQDYVESKRNLK